MFLEQDHCIFLLVIKVLSSLLLPLRMLCLTVSAATLHASVQDTRGSAASEAPVG